MPKLEKKENERAEKIKKSVSDETEKLKDVAQNKKGKANQNLKSKLQENKISKSKTYEMSKEKLIVKKNDTKKKEVVKKNATVKRKVTTTKKSANKEEKISKTKVKAKEVEETLKKYLPEYYDLPYRYNDTVVKILYQTPKRIFVYWDISDSDRQRYIRAFGENFFEETYPVLLVHNEDMNYTFEVPINDFANSWYLDINDTKTKYVVQLGRKFRNVEKEKINYLAVQEEKIDLRNDFIYITDSNKLETPNDRILFDKMPEKIVYRNVKTGVIVEKEVKQVLRKLSKIYDNPQVEDFYSELYGEEILKEDMDISNPTSGGSSTFI